MVLRAALWAELDVLGGVELAGVLENAEINVHLLSVHAGFALADTSTFLVHAFEDDPVGRAKLDEAFYRSEIPRGTYAWLRDQLVSKDRPALMHSAWQLHEALLLDPSSPLFELMRLEPEAATLNQEVELLYRRSLARLDDMELGRALSGIPGGREIAQGSNRVGRDLRDAEYRVRAVLFKDVSRLRRPRSYRIDFDAAQKVRIHALLQPGDLIFTYVTGVVSNIFIPGKFKHGIVYVGNADDRVAAGLSPQMASAVLRTQSRVRFESDLQRDTSPDDLRLDVIEAVAEGVKLSSLDHILDTHVNRLVILRPALGSSERASFLAQLFAYLGDPYDFRFDFTDASRQVCTEVIYRGLDGKGEIAFELVDRLGSPTLSADDIVDYHLATEGRLFRTLLYAEEDPGAAGHRARLLFGEKATARLEALMAPAGSGN